MIFEFHQLFMHRNTIKYARNRYVMMHVYMSTIINIELWQLQNTFKCWQSTPRMFLRMWYRVTTSLKALKAIYTLPEEHVREFLASYRLFDQEHVTGKNKEAENTVNYYKASGAMVQFDKTYTYYKQFLHLEKSPP